jgi:hypothetical protein
MMTRAKWRADSYAVVQGFDEPIGRTGDIYNSNIYQKPKDGSGAGDPVGINLITFRRRSQFHVA